MPRPTFGQRQETPKILVAYILKAIILIGMMNTTTVEPKTYKPVPTNFTKKGFTYRQLKRVGNKAIFEQTRKGSNILNYEVVRIGRHNGYTMGGVYIEPSETYPGSSLWGIMGWTCTSLEDAEARFDSIEG